MARYLETYAADPDMTWDRSEHEYKLICKEFDKYYIQLTNLLENVTFEIDSSYYKFFYLTFRMHMRTYYRYGGIELLPDVLREIFNNDEYSITILRR